ncbi:hypothetical protein F4779DRAFT_618564 [Xylariaceae sp. FL0662B]|nr:hypothetical protein F4779DRAFT_618564 [Xylariaceae sp. FL0662B]
MGEKSGWTTEKNMDLMLAIWDGAGTFKPAQQAQIAAAFQARGHATTWDAISQTKWDDQMHLALFQALFNVRPTTLTQPEQNLVVAFMQAQGYNVTWNGIR